MPLHVLTVRSRQVVDDFSSKLDLPRPLETVETIDADHRQMARCGDRSDAQYRAIFGVLEHFIRTKLEEAVPMTSVAVVSTAETEDATGGTTTGKRSKASSLLSTFDSLTLL